MECIELLGQANLIGEAILECIELIGQDNLIGETCRFTNSLPETYSPSNLEKELKRYQEIAGYFKENQDRFSQKNRQYLENVEERVMRIARDYGKIPSFTDLCYDTLDALGCVFHQVFQEEGVVGD